MLVLKKNRAFVCLVCTFLELSSRVNQSVSRSNILHLVGSQLILIANQKGANNVIIQSNSG